jgi:hypothetical protein
MISIRNIYSTDIHFCGVLEKDKLDRKKRTIDQALREASDELKGFLEECGNRYIAVNNVEDDLSKRQKMQEEVLQIVTKMMEENGNAVFSSELLAKVIAEVIKINKEGVGRLRANELRSGFISNVATAATVYGVEIVQDEELVPQIRAIIEEHVLPVLDSN